MRAYNADKSYIVKTLPIAKTDDADLNRSGMYEGPARLGGEAGGGFSSALALMAADVGGRLCRSVSTSISNFNLSVLHSVDHQAVPGSSGRLICNAWRNLRYIGMERGERHVRGS